MAVLTIDQARAQRSKDVDNAIASGRLEVLQSSVEAGTIFQRYIDGELTLEQMGAAIEAHAEREFPRADGASLPR